MTAAARAVAAQALAKAAAYDQRLARPDIAIVAAWTEAFAARSITRDEALTAVAEHYQRTTDTIGPANVIQLVKLAREVRRRHRPPALALPSRFENDAQRAERNRRGRALVDAAIAARKAEQ